jgi:thiosulfate/3-mercaptopyruvate sulfurtransferase
MSQAVPGAYTRADLLVEPDWLASHLADPNIVIVDCDPPEVAMMRAHIEGARLLPTHPYVRNTETGIGVATAAQMETIARGLGISNDTRVICYDSQGGLLAARVWWALWYHGHANVAILNGGWVAWQAGGFPASRTWTTAHPGSFVATTHEDRIASCDVILPGIQSGDILPLDVRAVQEWDGSTPNPANQQEGHIPGAVHIEWREFVDWGNDARFKTADELAALLESRGVSRDKRVVPY